MTDREKIQNEAIRQQDLRTFVMMDKGSPIVQFYRGEKVKECPYLFEEILVWSNGRMEDVHDYIQWLFPLNEPSRTNPNAPILTEEDIELFKLDPVIVWNVHAAIHKFMLFLTLGNQEWITSVDHNQFRITRMLKFLRLIGMDLEAQARYLEIRTILSAFPKYSGTEYAKEFWNEAMNF